MRTGTIIFRREELDISKETACRYLVLADDFKVETDQGTPCMCTEGTCSVSTSGIQIDGHSEFFLVPASAETGLQRSCRGSVVLTRSVSLPEPWAGVARWLASTRRP
jgi:hypothetical protein